MLPLPLKSFLGNKMLHNRKFVAAAVCGLFLASGNVEAQRTGRDNGGRDFGGRFTQPGGGGPGAAPGGGFRPGGGGPGGGFGPGGGMFGGPPGGFGAPSMAREIRNESVQADLKLTDSQKQQLAELGDQRDRGRERMAPFFEKMQSATTDEERQQIQAEMQAEMQKATEEGEEAVRKLLNAEQLQRLNQIMLQRVGTRAFLQEDVARDLSLTESQKAELTALQAQYDEARGQLGFRATDEEREQLRAQWEPKFTALLSPAQQQQWTQKIGDPAPVITRGGPGGPGGLFGPPGTVPGPPRPGFVEQVPEGAQVILSFAAPAAPGMNTPATAGTGSSDTATGEEPKLTFNFAYAPWGDVLKLFAELSNLTWDPQAIPPGTFTYSDPAAYTPTEALDVLNGYLIQRGYILVRRDQFLVSLNIDQGIPPNLVPPVTMAELEKRGRNELMTVVFPVAGLDVDLVANEIDQMRGPQGKVVSLKTSRSLMVTDIGDNLRRIKRTIDGMTSGALQDRSFQAYQLKNIGTDEAEDIIRVMLGAQIAAVNVSASSTRDSRGSSAPPVVSQAATIAADVRTNTLLITATAAEHLIIKETLATIDVDASAAGFSASSRKPYLVVYKVNGADAREVTKTINAMMPGIVINEDGQNAKIHIMATQKQHDEVSALIRQMDGMGGGLQQVAVIPLAKAEPLATATMLRAMFSADGTTAPTIEADLYNRQIMIRGNTDQVNQVKMLLTQMGEDGTGKRARSDSLIRSFPLSGRDPAEFLPILERAWGNAGQGRINVVRPQERGPVREILTPSKAPTELQPETQPGTTSQEAPARPRDEVRYESSSPLGASFPQTYATQAGEEAAGSAGSGSTQTLLFDVPITLTVQGDEILMASTDPEVLDALEEMIQETMRVVPPSTSWTIFTLQSADVTEVATILEQVISGANVSAGSTSGSMFGGMMGSVQNFGSGVMDMTGLTSLNSGSASALRIVKDTNLNALLVSGPTHKVREVEEWLRVLDSTDLSESTRNRLPRIISVEYADVTEVYTMVRDLYKDYLEDNQAQARAGANMLAAMMGSGGRGGGGQNNRGASEIRMTLSMDAANNNLLVSANEELFRQVEAFVKQLDTNALDANRTVRVVQLQNTSSTVVQQALGSLMPKVKIASSSNRSGSSSSSSSTPSSTPSASPPSGGAPQGAPNQDQMRQFFEQRMRERMQQGGGTGGSPFGGGGSPFGGGGSPFGGGGSPGGGSTRGGRGGR